MILIKYCITFAKYSATNRIKEVIPLEIQATRSGIKGTIHVGRKYITFSDEGTTIRVGEVSREDDGKYCVYGYTWVAKHENRKEAILLALMKAGFKIL